MKISGAMSDDASSGGNKVTQEMHCCMSWDPVNEQYFCSCKISEKPFKLVIFTSHRSQIAYSCSSPSADQIPIPFMAHAYLISTRSILSLVLPIRTVYCHLPCPQTGFINTLQNDLDASLSTCAVFASFVWVGSSKPRDYADIFQSRSILLAVGLIALTVLQDRV